MKFLLFNLVWLAILSLILFLVLFPIYNAIGDDYPFYWPNALFIIVTGICIRLIFFLEYSFIRKLKWIKLFIVFAIPLCLLPMSGYFVDFQELINSRGLQSIMSHLSHKQQTSLSNYIRSEMTFFGSSAILSSIALIFRMIRSLWRQKNTGRI